MIAQYIANGLLIGSLYACLAVGFSLIYGVLNIINVMHGSFVVLGAYVTIYCTLYLGVSPLIAAMIGCAVLFAFGKHLTGRISAGISHDATNAAVTGAAIFELLVAVYGGYFGGGIGIMNLAMLAAMGMTDIHAMNKLKVILGGIINGVATVTFIATRAILWPQGMVMTAGALLGGYSSAHYAQKLPQAWIRTFVIFVGAAMTIYFFIRGYR